MVYIAADLNYPSPVLSARHYMRGWLGWEEHLEQVNDSGLDREV